MSELYVISMIYDKTIRHSTKMTQVQALKKVKKKTVFSIFQNKTAKSVPKFKLGDLVRTAVFQWFSKKLIPL